MVCQNIWSKARQRWNHMRYTNVSINDATSMAKYVTSLTLQAAVTAHTLSTYFYSSHHPIVQHWSWILHEPHTSGGTKLFSSLYSKWEKWWASPRRLFDTRVWRAPAEHLFSFTFCWHIWPTMHVRFTQRYQCFCLMLFN